MGASEAMKSKAPTGSQFDRSIVLVGLMGAGKTSVGRRLAHRLDLPFIDADHEIEQAAGCTIEEIFKLYGEAEFRDGERRVMQRLLKGPCIVLATGGGAFMDPDTRAGIAENGISVWLRAELDVLLRRVLRRSDRPLLQQGDPRQTLEQLIDVRYPVYAEANITVDSSDGPHDVVVEKIVSELRHFIKAAPLDTGQNATT